MGQAGPGQGKVRKVAKRKQEKLSVAVKMRWNTQMAFKCFDK